MTIDQDKIQEGVRLILEGLGEDLSREGLKDTPARVARMYAETMSGNEENVSEILSKQFTSETSDIVLEKDITFFSTCEHHMMPFYGKVAIAYIPDGKVVGLSKLARCVDAFAKRLQIQEQLTSQIAEAVEKELHAKGVMVLITAEHTCMTMRGIKKPGSKTTTIAARGLFKKKAYEAKFFSMLNAE